MKNSFYQKYEAFKFNGLEILFFLFFSGLIHFLIFNIQLSTERPQNSTQVTSINYIQRSVPELGAQTQKPAMQAPAESSGALYPVIKKAEKSKEIISERDKLLLEPLSDNKGNELSDNNIQLQHNKMLLEPPEKVLTQTQALDTASVTEDKKRGVEIATEIDSIENLFDDSSNKIDNRTVPPDADQSSGIAGFMESMSDKPIKADMPILINAVPRYEVNPRPEYPEISRRRGQEGVVSLQVSVKKNGKVEKVAVLNSSGYRSLDKSAVKAVRRWLFKPALTGGIPTDSKVEVPIKFGLE